MNPAFLPILTFGAVAAAIAGVYSIMSDLYLRDRARVNQRLDDEFRKRQRERARKEMLFKDLNELATDLAREQEGPPTIRQQFSAMVEQSGLDLTPQRLLTIAGFTGLGRCQQPGGKAVVSHMPGQVAGPYADADACRTPPRERHPVRQVRHVPAR